MRNPFFNIALDKAAKMAGKPGRLLLLLGKLATKIKHVDWKRMDAASAKQQLFILGRFIKAYANGSYRNVDLRSMLILTAAILYFINPIDFIPDFIPLAGFTDDFGILVWVYNTLDHEIRKFLTWEQSQVNYENSLSSR